MRRRSFITAFMGMVGVWVDVLFRSGPRRARAEGGMMRGGDMGAMMSPQNMAGPMRTGMALFRNHKLIQRSVTQLPNGVHDVTTSEDPETAALIKEHVAEMYQRLDQRRAFPYPMSPSVTQMFEHSTHYERKLELLPNGVAVTETSSDPKMVAVIRAHAQELNRFARDGMPAMMRGMM
ncbi:MAG TPA: hypothetical protein VFN52_02705 [Acidiferrobacteraceae bacterium]|nr:hypothetical protein [Acidiferrobacteraceae bacterium]